MALLAPTGTNLVTRSNALVYVTEPDFLMRVFLTRSTAWVGIGLNRDR
jgi:hypothetical protein